MQDALTEALISKCRVATPHDTVLNSECAYTFHSPFTTPKGILVSMVPPYMGVSEPFLPADSSVYVRIVKERVEKQSSNEEEEMKVEKEPPAKLSDIATDEDKYEITSKYAIVVTKADSSKATIIAEAPYSDETKSSFPEDVQKSADGIIHHSGMAVQQDLKVWELDDEPKPVSKYAASLPFVDNGKIISANPSDWKCEVSGATENLWLNLSDGFIGGGRKNWDGSGGSNGAIDHYNDTGKQYPLVVKLGTITADVSSADCYSYAADEDGPVKIPNLAELLSKRGIKVAQLQKTVKSTAELEVELNATYAFDAITEAGSQLAPMAGAGYQGLQNLGNSCYMNSVVQVLSHVPEFSDRYNKAHDQKLTPKEATQSIMVQTSKLCQALTNGEFAGPAPKSVEVTDASSTDPKYRLQPRMFKHVVAGNHVDFRTGQQQDAAQYLQYLMETLDRAELGASAEKITSDLCAFQTTTRLEVLTDHKVKYTPSARETILSVAIPMEKAKVREEEEDGAPDEKRPKIDAEEKQDDEEPVPTISFDECMASWGATTTVEDKRWDHLNNAVAPTTSQQRLNNFPKYLWVQLQRYTLGADWSPQKLKVKLDMPSESIDLNAYKSTGPQEGETLVPDDDEKPTTAAQLNGPPSIDEGALAQLMDMGFSYNGCKRALTAVGGSDVQAAMNWVFEHNMDPDFNDPIPEPSEEGGAASAASNDSIDEGVVQSLVENLGCFTMDQVRAALKETSGAADRAADWLFSHMDDLDGAIAALNAKGSSSTPSSSNSRPYDDGNGKYQLLAMISHIGKHTGSGHYVAHIKNGDGKWVIYNDEKVALSEHPPIEHAYLYLFKRMD